MIESTKILLDLREDQVVEIIKGKTIQIAVPVVGSKTNAIVDIFLRIKGQRP